ncbi:hypothetical protein MFLAVUS_000503 [Mucor flavus]|uniref:MAS20-domain-containing protein n=1 Tax=Mucor flavus TaxID=439312 RepID=A0ABP9YJY5_9FUNG
MAVKASTIALISTAIAATFGVGYLVYFDQKRRTDPDFKRQLKRERKKATKVVKETQEKELVTVEALIQKVLEAVAQETFPEAPEAKEAYFMDKVSIGEGLCAQGEEFYDESVEHFYKALKIYPAPLELIMIYQKTLPEKVFRIIVNLMALEQQKRQTEFYQHFPPAETGVKFTELSVEADKPVYGLTANKDFNAGDVIYNEIPLISALCPALEGKYCNYCMKSLPETKIECTNCDQVLFCSQDCEKTASQQYHQFLCTNNKLSTEPNTASTFLDFSRENNLKYPQMIAQFLSGMVAEEVEKTKLGKAASPYSAWDHIERFKSGPAMEPTDQSVKEAAMIKELLATKVPGIDEFLNDEIYLLLKGKLNENCFKIPSAEEEEKETSTEPARVLDSEKKELGSAIYKISSYIVQSELESANISVTFKDNTNELIVTATKDIKKGEEIKTHYT